MKKQIHLLPVLALSCAVLALGACDDQGNSTEQSAVEQTTTVEPAATDSVVPAPSTDTAATVAAIVSAEGATSYATAEGASTGAIFLTLHNTGSETDRLVGASTSKASTVEIHEGYVNEADGTMQMRKVDGVDVNPGEQASLQPGGYHIMLMGLTAPLTQGETFDVTLDFEKAPDVTVPVTVTAPGATNAAGEETAPVVDHGTMNHDATATEGTAAQTPTDTTVPATDEPTDIVPETTPDTSVVPENEHPAH